MEKNMKLQAVGGGAIRLSVAANVAHDIGSLKASLKDLADRLGHPGCFTGCDIFHLGMERDFVVNPDRALNPQPLPPGETPALRQSLSLSANKPIEVAVPASVLNDVNKLSSVAASVLGKLGCAECSSGFDIAFRRQLEEFTVNEKLEVQQVAGVR